MTSSAKRAQVLLTSSISSLEPFMVVIAVSWPDSTLCITRNWSPSLPTLSVTSPSPFIWDMDILLSFLMANQLVGLALAQQKDQKCWTRQLLRTNFTLKWTQLLIRKWNVKCCSIVVPAAAAELGFKQKITAKRKSIIQSIVESIWEIPHRGIRMIRQLKSLVEHAAEKK